MTIRSLAAAAQVDSSPAWPVETPSSWVCAFRVVRESAVKRPSLSTSCETASPVGLMSLRPLFDVKVASVVSIRRLGYSYA